MSQIVIHRERTEGRRGSRIDVEAGGRYLAIPQNRLSPLTPCPGNRVRYKVTLLAQLTLGAVS